MREAFDFLKKCGTFFIATEEDGQPHVRPFGALSDFEGKIYIETNNQKKDFFGRFLKERHQKSLTSACGISVMFIGTAGAMEGMLTINDGVINSGQAMLVTICLALGTLIGEIIKIRLMEMIVSLPAVFYVQSHRKEIVSFR